MAGVFICHRREPNVGNAGRLYDRLVRRFKVFMDLSSGEAGLDFEEVIRKAVALDSSRPEALDVARNAGLLTDIAWGPDSCAPSQRPLIPDGNAVGKAAISFPAMCSETPRLTVVRGTYEAVPDGVDLWLFVYPRTVGLYYPQSDDASVPVRIQRSNGQWQVVTYIGRPTSGGEIFELVLVLANPTASQSLADTLKNWVTRQWFPGVSPADLPSGLTEAHAVTVLRPR